MRKRITLILAVAAGILALVLGVSAGAVGIEKTAMGLLYVVAIVVCVGGLVLLSYVIGKIPGDIARDRHNPNADAISLCGWVGLLFWPAWVVGLIWAHTNGKE